MHEILRPTSRGSERRKGMGGDETCPYDGKQGFGRKAPNALAEEGGTYKMPPYRGPVKSGQLLGEGRPHHCQPTHFQSSKVQLQKL